MAHIRIEFERTQDGYTFKDCICLPHSHTLTDAEIEQIKDQRFNVWYELITNPPVIEYEYQKDEEGNLVYDENSQPILLLDENGMPIPVGS